MRRRSEEAEREIQEAVRFHIEGLRADVFAVPEPTAICQYVET